MAWLFYISAWQGPRPGSRRSAKASQQAYQGARSETNGLYMTSPVVLLGLLEEPFENGPLLGFLKCKVEDFPLKHRRVAAWALYEPPVHKRMDSRGQGTEPMTFYKTMYGETEGETLRKKTLTQNMNHQSCCMQHGAAPNEDVESKTVGLLSAPSVMKPSATPTPAHIQAVRALLPPPLLTNERLPVLSQLASSQP